MSHKRFYQSVFKKIETVDLGLGLESLGKSDLL